MVRPLHFGYNEETADNNAFQAKDDTLSAEEVARRAQREFDAFVTVLREAGVQVLVAEDDPTRQIPDSVFPNNWVSFHADGTLITYPMFAQQRRLERRKEVLDVVLEKFTPKRRIHLEEYELKQRYLEGTGSLVLDRQNRRAYACRSVRTDDDLVRELCDKLDYTPLLFDALDIGGTPIYHTNVMMALGETFVVIALDTVRNEEEREQLLNAFEETEKEVIKITLEQMMAFAGNMLQVRNQQGDTYLVMSEQAYGSLSPEQIEVIEKHTGILYSPVSTIETYGGGSARCMMAEVFLPEKEAM